MLHDYRNWLEFEVKRLEGADGNFPAEDGCSIARLALERFEAACANTLYVALDRPLARRVLTAVELLDQQSTALHPEFEALREAIKIAFAEAIHAPAEDREPLEGEFL